VLSGIKKKIEKKFFSANNKNVEKIRRQRENK